MLTIRHVRDGQAALVDRAQLDDARRAGGYLWIDLLAPTDEEETVLDDVGIHPMVVEDMREDRHLPKVEAFGDLLALTVHGVHLDVAEVELSTVELDIAMTDRLVVTFHEERLASVAAVAGRFEHANGGPTRPVELVHLILDTLTDVFMPFLDLLERRLDVIEDDILSSPTEATRHDIYGLQRDLIQLRRVVVPQAEVIRRLGRDPLGPVGTEDQALFRDLYDHLYRMVELSESYRQLLDGAMASYRSALDDRLNAMLTTLTLVSVILLPVTVIASVWGTNFVSLPGVESPAGFWLMVASFVVVIGAMLTWFRVKGWIGRAADRRALERRRTALGSALEVPILGTVLKVPIRGARAVLGTSRSMRGWPRRPSRRRPSA